MNRTKKRTEDTQSALTALRTFIKNLGLEGGEKANSDQSPTPETAATDSGSRDEASQEIEPDEVEMSALGQIRTWLTIFAFGLLLTKDGYAANLESTLQNVVNSFVGRILPIVALGYLGKNIFAHIQGDPNAKHETIRVVIATVCLIAINAVWSYLNQQVR